MDSTIETVELREVNLVDRVYRSMRAAILDGTYAPDARLRLNALARDNEVSLIPVREALRLLEGERLVVNVPNKGARVAPVSLSDMSDLYVVRKVLEVEAVRLAGPELRKGSLDGLRRLADEMVKRLEAEDPGEYLKLHREFHFGIYECSGSDWLIHIIEALWGHAERYIQIATRQEASIRAVGEAHHLILDKLESNDIDGASAAVMSDLDGTIDRVRNAVSDGLIETDG